MYQKDEKLEQTLVWFELPKMAQTIFEKNVFDV